MKTGPPTRRFAVIGIAAVLFFLAVSPQTHTQAVEPVLDTAEEAKISQMLADSGVPSISIAIVEHGHLAYARGFGKASLIPERVANTYTRYAIGSITKQFTAAAVLLLAEQGALSLDDKVSKYYPDLTRAHDITIRQLLSHTSGYEDYAPQDYIIPEWTKPNTPDAVIERWATKPLNFEPGTRWQYSNTNYVIAARIAEKAAGQHLLPFLRNKVFGPLGMTSAGDFTTDKSSDDAVAYTRYALGPSRPVVRENSTWYFGAGNLCMSASDVARWDVALLHKQVLNSKSYGDFTREVRLANGDSTHYALGLQLGEFENIPRLFHGGEVSGFLSLNTVYPTHDAAIVVLINQDSVDMIRQVTDELSGWILDSGNRSLDRKASEAERQTIQNILTGLQNGHIDRSVLTSNLNFYFSDVALKDMQASLSPLGEINDVTRVSEVQRGGMVHPIYEVKFEKKTLRISVYITSDGHFEQFLIKN